MTVSIYLIVHCIENTFANWDYSSPQRTSCFHVVPIERFPPILLHRVFDHRPEIPNFERACRVTSTK
jgi:hypothetical protein